MGKIDKKIKIDKNSNGSREGKHFLYSKIFFWLILFLVCVLIFITVKEFDILEKLDFSEREPLFVEIKDGCSFMPRVGLVHQIRDDADCLIRCKNECDSQGMIRERIDFVKGAEGACHMCNCYCE